MKKIIVILTICMLVMSCSPRRSASIPPVSALPSDFAFVKTAGNGYWYYRSPQGYFLVSVQKQGELKIGYTNSFVDIVYLGPDL